MSSKSGGGPVSLFTPLTVTRNGGTPAASQAPPTSSTKKNLHIYSSIHSLALDPHTTLKAKMNLDQLGDLFGPRQMRNCLPCKKRKIKCESPVTSRLSPLKLRRQEDSMYADHLEED